jgi:RNA polymerase sigma-70 factor, ECF subfamily
MTTDDWPEPVIPAPGPRAAQRSRGRQERPVTLDDGVLDFDDFYGAVAKRIVRHAYALTGNISDAQDITQEAFARAWQRWDSVRACDAPEAWVRRVATNLATSRFRRDRTARTAAWQLVAGPVPEIGPDTVALVAALKTLPERQRVVVVLHYLADLPIGQIATELHCPSGSVKAWLSRGRAALALALAVDDKGHSAQEAADA